ncbi:MAG: hypothetical protein LUE11_05345 [Clostridia bacterium]|nr:hypothetical protein [Clostridia bacterium]
MTIQDKIRIGKDSEGNEIYATVIFVHPKKRFITIEIPAPYGAKIRETRYIGIRRGNRQPSGRWISKKQ